MNFGKTNKEQPPKEIHEKHLDKLHNMPYIETKYGRSKDKRFVIVKTIITDIKPVTYWEKVFSDDSQ